MAVALPIPEPAPVINAVFPFSLFIPLSCFAVTVNMFHARVRDELRELGYSDEELPDSVASEKSGEE
jgi:hypothetical protein